MSKQRTQPPPPRAGEPPPATPPADDIVTPPPLPPLPPPVPPAGFVPTDADVDLLSRLIQICRPYPAAVREAIALRNRLKSLVPLSADSPPPPPQPPDEPPPN